MTAVTVPIERLAVRPKPLRELLLLTALFVAYKLGRVVAEGNTALAMDNADRVWRFERLLRLPSEVDVQQLLLSSAVVARAANIHYATVHFAATAAFLLWMYLRRPAYYRWARRSLALVTAAALVVHFAMPLAPPRMLTSTGLIDLGARYGPAVYGPPQDDAMNNQYAAMPSMHVGWAVLVAIGLIVTAAGPWRWLWLAHPAVTLLVVVGTAHHYWLDGIVAAILLAGALVLGRNDYRRAHARQGPATRHGPAGLSEQNERTSPANAMTE